MKQKNSDDTADMLRHLVERNAVEGSLLGEALKDRSKVGRDQQSQYKPARTIEDLVSRGVPEGSLLAEAMKDNPNIGRRREH